MWSCQKCGTEVDDGLERCWQCGGGRDGSGPPEGWRSELAGLPQGSERQVRCLRCQSDLAFAGSRRLHDSSFAREAFLGEFFVNREALDIYVCRGCGKVEFFAPQAARR